jgi:transcriptional regulator with GAF, ATPase, and Fis domain
MGDSSRLAITQLIADRGGAVRGEQRPFDLAVAGQPARRFCAEVVTIGSSPHCDVAIPDASVSRHHARIEVRGGGELVIQDLGSTNGTSVDGVRIATAFLERRAHIVVGRTALEFALTDQAEPFDVYQTTAFGRLRGKSLAMRRLFAKLDRIATTDATVLIRGESGTGKELIAEALHERGRRASGPFVVVDCGALPASLIESELFGHEKGAFTGALQSRAGAFELADGGTLFLDEIGELELGLQPRLLRALEGRQVKRLGASAYKSVDVRVIAATHRDLAAMVTAGDFREDLYYRIAVVELRVPPLRERPDDLELLAQLFAAQLAEREPGARRDALTPAMLAALRERRWTGNARELRNFIERAVLLGDADPEAATPPTPSVAAPPAELARPLAPYAVARQEAIDQFERDYVRRALDAAGGNVARAARDCGVERSYLFKLIRRLGLRKS